MSGGVVRWLLALVLGAALLALVPSADAAAPSAPSTPAARRDVTQDRTITVSWNGVPKHRETNRSVTVPGAGQLKLVCRPDATMIQLAASSPGAETQMWLAKHETKNGRDVVAVKTVRIYASTGSRGHEGLNQRTPIENDESGYAEGLISVRPGRGHPALAATLRPATSFELTWWWTGFRERPADQQCTMTLTLRTAPSSYGISWHGDDDAASGPDTRAVAIPGIGAFSVTCRTGRTGEQDITLAPVAAGGWSGAYVETTSGEGAADDHIDDDDYDVDEDTGLIGPIPLPGNGMLRIFFTVGSAHARLIVSSYAVTNDDLRPDSNVCEVAAAPF